MKILFLLIFTFAGIHCPAQDLNLVPNPGFEECTNCDICFSEAYKNNNINPICKDWGSAYLTPDYIYWASIQYNRYVDTSGVRSGNGSYGFYAYAADYQEVREFVKVKLKSRLQSNKTYKARMFIKLLKGSYFAIDAVGLYFSNNSTRFYSDTDFIQITPQVKNLSGRVLDSKWTLITGTFIANGDEQYLTIGNFEKQNKVRKKVVGKKDNRYQAYYYMDDISLVLCEDCSENETNNFIIGKPFELNKIYFQSNQFVLPGTAYVSLDSLCDYLKLNPQLNIEITGQTDGVGNQADNKILSQNRAKSVASYLNKKGIENKRISTKGIQSGENNKENSSQRSVSFMLQTEKQ